jgi:uncharacterized alkaline shock family protein YloU
MEGHASVAADVLARYATDAAREVDGVRGLRRAQIEGQEQGPATVVLRLELDWGASAPEVGSEVQRHVADYLERMAGARPRAVNVVVDAIGPR